MKFTIIADSSCDLKDDYIKSKDISFETIPLSISINGEDWVDDESLDTLTLIDAMKANKTKPVTACPSVERFAEAMRNGGDIVFCVTITSKLSGTYNSARLAAEAVMAENPEKKIYVVDSLATSCSMILIIDKLVAMIEAGTDFEQMVEQIDKFRDNTKVRFVLQDFGNLVKTGRMSKVKGAIATGLGIKLICGDDGQGEIKQVAKSIGLGKAMQMMSDLPQAKMESNGKDTPIVISHCQNEEGALQLKRLIEEKHGATNVRIVLARGLVTFYANNKGLIIGY